MANSGITWGKPLIEFGLTGAEMQLLPVSKQCPQPKKIQFFLQP